LSRSSTQQSAPSALAQADKSYQRQKSASDQGYQRAFDDQAVGREIHARYGVMMPMRQMRLACRFCL
jgi:hypothetical protein